MSKILRSALPMLLMSALSNEGGDAGGGAAAAPVEKTKEILAVEAAQANVNTATTAHNATVEALASAEANVKAATDDATKAAAEAGLKAAKKAETDAKKTLTNFTKSLDKAKTAATKAAEKAEKEAKKAAEKAAKEKVKLPEQNGVTKPKAGTLTGKVWELADSISQHLGQPAPIANLLKEGEAQGLNDSTIRTQYARWRAFHGITGRVVAPAPAPAPAPVADNSQPAA